MCCGAFICSLNTWFLGLEGWLLNGNFLNEGSQTHVVLCCGITITFAYMFDIPTTFLMKAMLLRGQQLGITRGNHGCYGFASGFGTKPEYNTLSSGLHLLYYLLLKHFIFFFCSSTGISRLYLSIRGALTKP